MHRIILVVLTAALSLGCTPATSQQKDSPRFQIRDQTITYSSSFCENLHRILDPVTRATHVVRNFSISNNHFIQSQKTITDILQECPHFKLNIQTGLDGHFVNNTFERPVVISALSGGITFAENSAPYFYFADATNGAINLSNNTTNSIFHFNRCRYDRVHVSNNVFKEDTASIHVMYSSIQEVLIFGNRARILNIRFFIDTLGVLEVSNIFNKAAERKSQLGRIEFFQCRLENMISIDDDSLHSGAILFDQCSFGPQAHLLGINVDTIVFNRCIEISKGMQLRTAQRTNPTILKLVNTDITNIDFEYDDNLQLHHWSDDDKTKSIYELLLSKFQSDKKLSSYRKVDIEYFKFQHNAFINTVAYLWWYYGYNKWLVVVWTLFFLLIFAIVNFVLWDGMRKTYPIDKNDHITDAQPFDRFIKVVIYTSIIFFSLRVDFAKLSFKRVGWLSYFFIQYATGLICLFFIVNWILKA